MQLILEEKYNIEVNPTAANDHVGEVERMIRTVKERVCASMNVMTWKMSVPIIIARDLVLNVAMMVNYFPPNSGLLTNLSPRNIMKGRKLDYKKHFRLLFGDYCQLHEQEEPRHSQKESNL